MSFVKWPLKVIAPNSRYWSSKSLQWSQTGAYVAVVCSFIVGRSFWTCCHFTIGQIIAENPCINYLLVGPLCFLLSGLCNIPMMKTHFALDEKPLNTCKNLDFVFSGKGCSWHSFPRLNNFLVVMDMIPGCRGVAPMGVLTPTLFLPLIRSFAQTPHYSRVVSLATLVCARCSCCSPSPSLSCCSFKHYTGFGTDQLMIGCSALSPSSPAVLDLLFSLCWWCENYRKIPNNSGAFIWDRRLIPSSQKYGMKMSQTSPASLCILWHPSGHNTWKRWGEKTCSVSGHVFFLDVFSK